MAPLGRPHPSARAAPSAEPADKRIRAPARDRPRSLLRGEFEQAINLWTRVLFLDRTQSGACRKSRALKKLATHFSSSIGPRRADKGEWRGRAAVERALDQERVARRRPRRTRPHRSARVADRPAHRRLGAGHSVSGRARRHRGTWRGGGRPRRRLCSWRHFVRARRRNSLADWFLCRPPSAHPRSFPRPYHCRFAPTSIWPKLARVYDSKP